MNWDDYQKIIKDSTPAWGTFPDGKWPHSVVCRDQACRMNTWSSYYGVNGWCY